MVIGAALYDPEVYRDVHAHGLRAHMFEDLPMSRVWQAIGTTIEAGEPVQTLQRVAAHLRDDAGLTVTDLAKLQSAVPSTANLSFYVTSVRKAHIHRELDRLPELLSDEDPGVRAREIAQQARTLAELGSSQRIKVHRDWSGEAPPREWICEGWLGYRLTLFTGHGGRGKSRLALQLAAAVASGTYAPWLPPESDDTRTVPGAAIDGAASASAVLLASWEDEQDEVHRRLQTMAMDERLPWAAPERIENRLNFADLAGYGPLWETTEYSGGKLTDTGHELREIAERIEARLLIIDPRAAAYAGDENNRAQVRAFISHWDRWARETQCAVLVVDHLPKYATKPRKDDDDEGPAYAGSTDWHNAARSVWTLERTEKGGTLLRCDKSNYGPAPKPVHLTSGDGCAWFATGAEATDRLRPGEVA